MMRNMGEMRHRIVLERPVNGEPNPTTGYPEEGWKEVAQVWAYREDKNGSEFFSAAAVQMKQVTEFTIHYRDDLDNAMRITEKGRHYEITAISEGRGVGDFCVLKCQEKEKEGG